MPTIISMPPAAAPDAGDPAGPAFEYVQVLGAASGTALQVARLVGLNTAHAGGNTDRGRLFAKLTASGGTYTLGLYTKATRASGSMVAVGSTEVLGEYFSLAAYAGSGLTGQAIVAAFGADDDGLLLLPTFAVDEDVAVQQALAAALPGFDATYGLAWVHARAQRELYTIHLPAACPHLFGGAAGGPLAGFVPTTADAALPDLSTLANADMLRAAQAFLAKAIACEEKEELEEYAQIAKLARARFDAIMERIGLAQKPAEAKAEAADPDAGGGVGFDGWRRG